MTKYISDYITLKEYRCPHCKQLPLDFVCDDPMYIYLLLFDCFVRIRKEWGGPLRIGPPDGGGGYRCPKYNYMIGGKPLSAHMFGCGLDPDISTPKEVDRLDAIIEDVAPELRRGTYKKSKTIIHIDNAYLIRPRASSDWEQGVRWND